MKKFLNILNKTFAVVRSYFMVSLFMLMLLVFVSFAEHSVKEQRCEDIIIRIYPDKSNQFLDINDIMNNLLKTNKVALQNLNFKNINTRELETGLMKNSFVENAEVYFDLKGNLYVDVYHRMPVLRIMSSSGQNYYIDKDGVHMPLSPKHTDRILVATGFIEKASRDSDYEYDLYILAEKIRNDIFLNSLIGQIHVKYDGEVILVPKVENLNIEFGRPDNIEYKIKKLKIFYQKIIPFEGWNKYNKVDLRFSNQIVLNRK